MAKKDVLSASLEDYLEVIHHIVKEKKASKAKDIAERLGVNNSSVTGALRTLSQKGYINYAPYDLITLTPKGKKLSTDIIKRHNTLFNFFVDVLLINESEADEVACKMEHYITPAIVTKMSKFIDFASKAKVDKKLLKDKFELFCKKK